MASNQAAQHFAHLGPPAPLFPKNLWAMTRSVPAPCFCIAPKLQGQRCAAEFLQMWKRNRFPSSSDVCRNGAATGCIFYRFTHRAYSQREPSDQLLTPPAELQAGAQLRAVQLPPLCNFIPLPCLLEPIDIISLCAWCAWRMLCAQGDADASAGNLAEHHLRTPEKFQLCNK